jgi:alpha-beta hydrolase superfamily lysophospholipase
MAARGFSTYAVDLRGMGLSGGQRGHVARWSDWIEDYAAFWESLQGRPELGELVPLGHSFGGVVVLSAAVRGRVVPRRFVVSNPALRTLVRVPAWKLRLGRLSSALLPRLALGNEVDPSFVSRDPEVVKAYRSDPLVHDRISSRLFAEWRNASAEVLARAGEIASSFLVIRSEDDRLVDPAVAEELRRAATGGSCELRTYPGRYHEPFNDLGSEEVFADLAAWLGAASPSRPGLRRVRPAE